jgi:hypothetical protein
MMTRQRICGGIDPLVDRRHDFGATQRIAHALNKQKGFVESLQNAGVATNTAGKVPEMTVLALVSQICHGNGRKIASTIIRGTDFPTAGHPNHDA